MQLTVCYGVLWYFQLYLCNKNSPLPNTHPAHLQLVLENKKQLIKWRFLQSKVWLISVLIFPRQPLGQNHKGIGCLFDINQMKVYLQWNNNSCWVTLYIILLFNFFTDCSHARFKQIEFHAYNQVLHLLYFPVGSTLKKEDGIQLFLFHQLNVCMHRMSTEVVHVTQD